MGVDEALDRSVEHVAIGRGRRWDGTRGVAPFLLASAPLLRVCVAAGVGQLTGFRFHDLRHTYAALMVAAGAHPKYLQAQMGHSSIRVTLDLYGHLFPDANRGVLDALDALTTPSTPHRANAQKTTPGLRERERRDSNPRPPA